MIKSIMKHLIYGLAGGSLLLVIYIILMDLSHAGGLYAFFDNFTINALGFLAIAVGFSMSAIIYDFERPALWQKISLNVLVGFGIFFLVGFYIGIISIQSPIWIVVSVVIAFILFFIAYFIDYLFSKREARAINKKLREEAPEALPTE